MHYLAERFNLKGLLIPEGFCSTTYFSTVPHLQPSAEPFITNRRMQLNKPHHEFFVNLLHICMAPLPPINKSLVIAIAWIP